MGICNEFKNSKKTNFYGIKFKSTANLKSNHSKSNRNNFQQNEIEWIYDYDSKNYQLLNLKINF